MTEFRGYIRDTNPEQSLGNQRSAIRWKVVPVHERVDPGRTARASVWVQGVWRHSKDVRQAVKELEMQVSRSEQRRKR